MRLAHEVIPFELASSNPPEIRAALETFVNAVNRRLQELVLANNLNEASAIVVEGTSSADLPTPELNLRGRIGHVAQGAGVRDELYVCRKNAADAYEWAQVTVP